MFMVPDWLNMSSLHAKIRRLNNLMKGIVDHPSYLSSPSFFFYFLFVMLCICSN